MKPVKVEVAEPIYIPADRSGDSESAIAQVFPALLSGFLSATRKHFVICASIPFLDKSQRESVASQLCPGCADAACDFIVSDTEGKATVIADTGEDRASAFEVAAAVAVVKASCGWDETKPIIVHVNGIKISIIAEFDGGGWVASSSDAG